MQGERSPSRKNMQRSLIVNTPEQHQNGQNRMDFSIHNNPLRRSYVQSNINEPSYYPSYSQQFQPGDSRVANLSKTEYQGYPEHPPQSQYRQAYPTHIPTAQLKAHPYILNSPMVQTIHGNPRQTRTVSTANLSPLATHPPLPPRMNNLIKETVKSQQKQEHLSQQLKQLLQEITEKHLPQLVSQATKELFEDMQSIKAELLSYKTEFKSFERRQEEVTSSLASIAGLQQQVKDSLHSVTELNELQRNYFLLESKYNQIESKNSQRFKQLSEQIKREVSGMKDRLGDWKPSGVKSKLPAVMLEYKELFGINGESVTLSSCTYYIDAQGYLMDCENRYLLDSKGTQIRLEDKHLKLLGIYSILK